MIDLNRQGIYKILCAVNGKFYIGSATNLRKRLNSHFSKLYRKAHHSAKLQYDYDLYGKDSFDFVVLEYCDKSIDDLIALEQKYLDLLKPYEKGYNINKSAKNCYGIIRSDEFREKCRNRQLGARYGDSTKKKHSENLKNQYAMGIRYGGRPLVQITDGSIIYASVKEASILTGLDSSSLVKACKGKLKSVGGRRWNYLQ